MAEQEYKPEMASADDATKEREKVFQQWKTLTGDEAEDQRRARLEDVLRRVAQQTLSSMSSPAQMQQTAGAIDQTARMGEVEEQGQALNRSLTESQMAGDIDVTRKAQTAKKFQFQAANKQQEMGRKIAQSLFDQGMDAKKLVMANNSAIADAAFEQMREDFDQGRITSREIERFQRVTKLKATKMKQEADEMLKQAMVEFESDLQKGNFDRAKARITKAIDAQLDALETTARANNIGAIISGTTRIIGAM